MRRKLIWYLALYIDFIVIGTFVALGNYFFALGFGYVAGVGPQWYFEVGAAAGLTALARLPKGEARGSGLPGPVGNIAGHKLARVQRSDRPRADCAPRGAGIASQRGRDRIHADGPARLFGRHAGSGDRIRAALP